jgi:parvulin-like peptidyl-prolyl isomerase
MDEAFALSQGRVSKVLEIPSGPMRGYYIIKVTGKYPKKFLMLDDIHLGYGETVRVVLREAIMQSKQQELIIRAQQELIEELRKDSSYTVFEENLNY